MTRLDEIRERWQPPLDHTKFYFSLHAPERVQLPQAQKDIAYLLDRVDRAKEIIRGVYGEGCRDDSLDCTRTVNPKYWCPSCQCKQWLKEVGELKVDKE